MKKLILIISLCLFLTGCVNYDILVDYKHNIDEKVTLVISENEIIENSIFNTKEEVKDYINEISANFKIKNKKGIYTLISHNKYKSLEDYSNNSELLAVYLNNGYFEKVNQGYRLFASTYYGEFCGELMESESENFPNITNCNNEEIEISFQFHNKIIENNADRVDNKKNIYTWNIDPNGDEKEIYVLLSNDKRMDLVIPYFIINNIGYILLFLIIISGSIYLLLKKIKQSKTI